MSAMKTTLKPVGSLRLTVALMALAIVLIFCATWAQIDKGIWAIIDEYFRSFWIWVPFRIFMAPSAHEQSMSNLGFPLPGGYLVGGALLVNLLAAHAVRFKISWHRSGILMIHASVILLLVGQAITGEMALERQMPIYEGQSRDWGHDIREVELAIVDHGLADCDQVAVLRQSRLETVKEKIRDDALPVDLKVEQFMVNSRVSAAVDRGHPGVTHGLGKHFEAIEVREVSGVGGQSVNYPSAVISLFMKDGDLIGRYLVSPHFHPLWITMSLRNQRPDLALALVSGHVPDDQVEIIGQTVEVGAQSVSIYLRFRRYYNPYTMRLTDFTHEFYTGTQVHKSFSSLIHLTAPNVDRDALIYMNHPLRYEGETFFQSGWLGADQGTVLQVVRNPAWQIPYIACLIGAVGLLTHFGIHLIRFVRRSLTH